MKRFTQIGFVVLFVALMVTMPVSAAATDVTTSVSMAAGGGNAPTVMAKWETEPGAASLESGDVLHNIPGSQFNPPATFNGAKFINYYAVVTDQESGGNVQMTYADVEHPDGTFKYQIMFTQLNKTEGIAAFNAVKDIGLLKLGINSLDAAFVLNELNKETAAVWVGTAEIHYCQMDGNYPVGVRTVDQNQNPSAWLNNTFYYVPVTAAEYDFTAVNYGSVSMGAPAVWRAGDTLFSTADKPTVRNVGNTRLNIIVNQSAMGFGKDVLGVWDVQFDARLGHTSSEPLYNPLTDHMLLDTLDRSHTDELDFSIHVIKGFGAHSGTMTLRTINPDPIVGPQNP
jgi:hypothetical protein